MEEQNTKKKKILAVDDNKQILEMLSWRLSNAGYEVRTSAGSVGVLDKVKKFLPDLILLDIMMPGADGLDVKTTLNQDPVGANIPVIFLTAKAESSDKVKGLDAGAEDYVTKPYDGVELLARIENAIKRKEKYEKISMTDGLTRLHNTNFFNKQMKTFFNIAKRYEKMFSLMIIDIDDFKKINDTHGHVTGDFVLRTFAEVASMTARKADTITRYGGDEFTIIMPETGEEQGRALLGRLRDKIHGKSFLFKEKNIDISFSFSAGVVAYDKEFENEIQMFAVADSRLYEEKRRKKAKTK